LLRLFGAERIQGLMGKLGMTDGEAIESSMLTKVIESSQHKVVQMHFDIRKQLLAYDNVMNQQREAVYSERHTILREDDMRDYGWGVVEGVFSDILDRAFPEHEDADPARAASRIRAILGPCECADTVSRLGSRSEMENAKDEITEAIKSRYDAKIADLSSGVGAASAIDNLIRYIVLNILDDAWRDHLLGMDELRHGIGLRAIGQKDPLLEYQFESFNLFQEMMTLVRRSFAEQFFRVKVVSENAPRRAERVGNEEFSALNEASRPRSASMQAALRAGEGAQTPVRKGVRVGRNDPCPCGSGKKYKHCCGRNA
jgi:preprotein translocase subunit SecA